MQNKLAPVKEIKRLYPFTVSETSLGPENKEILIHLQQEESLVKEERRIG